MPMIATAPALGRLLERRLVSNTTTVPSDISSSVAPPASDTSQSTAPHSSTISTKSKTTNIVAHSSSTPPDTTTNPGGTPATSKSAGNTGLQPSNTFQTRTQPAGDKSRTNGPTNIPITGSSYIPQPSRTIPSPIHVSPSSFSPTTLGPLTTKFTPPANCGSLTVSFSGSTSDYITQGFGTTGGVTDIYVHRQSCYPEHPDLLNQIPIYSPGICPYSWTMHFLGVSYRPSMPHLTTATCCPSGATPSQSWMCVQTPVDTIVIITGIQTTTSTMNTYRPISNNIRIGWQSTDCLLLPTGCPPVPHGLTQGAKIGIGVGVGLGGLLLIVGLVVGALALRKRRKRISPAYADMSQRYSSPPPTYDTGVQEVKANPTYELMPEHDQRLPELGSQHEWGGAGNGK